MRRAVSICAIVLLALLDAGCIDSKPVHYYTIEAPTAPVAPPAPSGPAITVGNISMPELQDGRIQYRLGSNEMGAYQFHRWIERPGTMVSASLVQALRASGRYRSVTESSSAAGGDYILRGRLYEFDEVDGESIETRISLGVDLVDEKTKRIVWQDLVRREEPVHNKNVPDVVASLDRNLRAVVKETAGGISRFLGSNEVAPNAGNDRWQ